MLIKLGAGTSLPGLVAAKIGAQNVVLCDNPKVEKWFPLIREIVTMNSMIADRIRIEFLDWYDESSIDEFIKKYCPLNIDVIFGSDIFFHKKGRKRNALFFLLN
jgi:predicted nicotinamide N-methyase